MKAMFLMAAVLLVGFSAASLAGNSGQNYTPIVVAASTIDSLKAASGNKELKCTSSGQTHTCTSDYAFVCPSGWSACKLTGGAKTCCTNK
jgi:hypothetical protein